MNKEAVGYIKQAIISEIEGYEFYKMAAKQAKEETIKATFLDLANEERKHVEWLQEFYEEISGKGNKLDLASIDAPPTPDIFNWDHLDREHPSTVMSVFGIALQLEKMSVEFYHDVAAKSDDPNMIELFSILEAWEKAHYQTFNKEYQSLQQEWWSEQRFAPF